MCAPAGMIACLVSTYASSRQRSAHLACWSAAQSCDGLGLMEEHRSLRVVVPAGVKDSDWVRVGGLGNVGECGGEAGDLFVKW